MAILYYTLYCTFPQPNLHMACRLWPNVLAYLDDCTESRMTWTPRRFLLLLLTFSNFVQPPDQTTIPSHFIPSASPNWSIESQGDCNCLWMYKLY